MEENKTKEMTPLEALNDLFRMSCLEKENEGHRNEIAYKDKQIILKELKSKTKVSPTESYLLKRVKQLEKENKKLLADLVVERGHREYNAKCLVKLANVCKELAQHFEIRTDENDKFDFSYFGGSYLHVINKSGEIEKCDKALIDFLNYVKENL